MLKSTNCEPEQFLCLQAYCRLLENSFYMIELIGIPPPTKIEINSNAI